MMNFRIRIRSIGLCILAGLLLTGASLWGQDSVQTYLDTGTDLVAARDYKGGLSAFQNALRLDPNSVAAIRNIGSAFMRLENDSQALVYLERAHKMDPLDPQVCNNIGVVFANAENSLEAIRYFELAVTFDSTNEKYLTNLGQEYSKIGRLGQAFPPLRAAWAINQKNALIPYVLGNCFAAVSSYDSAEFYYLQSAKLHGRPAALYYRLGTVQNRLGKTVEASESFIEALKRQPVFKECRQSLAMVYLTDQQYRAAAHEFEVLCKSDSSFYPAWIGYGTCMAMIGQGEESARILSRLFAVDSALGFQMLEVIGLQKQ